MAVASALPSRTASRSAAATRRMRALAAVSTRKRNARSRSWPAPSMVASSRSSAVTSWRVSASPRPNSSASSPRQPPTASGRHELHRNRPLAAQMAQHRGLVGRLQPAGAGLAGAVDRGVAPLAHEPPPPCQAPPYAAHHFLDRRGAGQRRLQSGLEHRYHAGGDGGALDRGMVGAGEHQPRDLIVRLEELGDRLPAAIAGAAAVRAADRRATAPAGRRARLEAEALDQLGRRLGRAAAVRAQPAHQPLRQHAAQHGGDQVVLQPHVAQPGDAGGGRVGVQRGQHQMPGQRRLHGDLRGLQVADFADHDHVRILAQDRAQQAGEGQADLRLDLDLVDAAQLVLDRVLDGDHLAASPN